MRNFAPRCENSHLYTFPEKLLGQPGQECDPCWDLEKFEKVNRFEAVLVLPVSESLSTLVLGIGNFILRGSGYRNKGSKNRKKVLAIVGPPKR